MASDDIFRKPFDEGTKTKLEIFQSYLKEWLPVFLTRREVIWPKIQIFDFCAGRGKDVDNVPGSPIIILNELNAWQANIVTKRLDVRVILNEYRKNLYENLLPHVEEIQKPNIYQTEKLNKDFHDVFNSYYDSMKSTANLLFIDQSGVKLITEDVFSQIINLKQTDFLFFISSSFFSRFSESNEFKKYLKISRTEIENKSYYHIHKIVLQYYRSLIPANKKYYLAPFSIKKGSNIYGLIFGTNHTLGMEKFLNVCWGIDKHRGEANFDIDKEKINDNEPTLFSELNVPNKRQVFESDLENKIIDRQLNSVISVYTFSLNNGFLPKDANKVLKELKSKGKIDFQFRLISSDIHKIKNASTIKIK